MGTILKILLVVVLGVMMVSISRHRRGGRKARASAAQPEAWILEQLARWRRGELVARKEPSIVGNGEVWVIEPTPGHRIVVGTVGRASHWDSCDPE